jgi:hypothetical protein
MINVTALRLSFVSVSNPVIAIDNVVLWKLYVTCDAGSGFDSYLWSAGETLSIIIQTVGSYSVTVSGSRQRQLFVN